MNRKIMLIPLTLAAAFSLVACNGGNQGSSTPSSEPSSSSSSSQAVVGVTVDKATVSLEVGASELVTATVTGTDTKTVTWTSSDTTVATVTSGLITGVKEGTATITVTSTADTTKSATIAVTVTASQDTTDVITIKALQETTPTYVDQNATFADKVAIEGRVVTITSGGILVYDGTAVILVYSNSAKTVAAVGEYVRVEGTPTRYKAKETDERWWQFSYKDEGLSITKITHDEIALPATATAFDADTLKDYVTPAAGTVNYVSFTGKANVSGSNVNIYLGDYTDKLLSLDSGTFTVTSGLSYNFKGYVAEIKSSKYLTFYPTDMADITYDAVTSVAITNGATATVKAGASLELTATVTPESANPLVTWSSSDDTKATVSSDGVVTGVAAGSAVITATSVGDNTKTASITVTVTEEPEGLVEKSFDLTGDSLKNPTSTTDTSATWGENGLAVTLSKNTSTSWDTGNMYGEEGKGYSLRVYKSCKLSVVTPGNIYSISFVFDIYSGEKYGSSAFTGSQLAEGFTASATDKGNAVVSVEGEHSEFNVVAGAQIRIKKITVKYVPSSTAE